MIVYLLLAGIALSEPSRCPVQYPFVYRPTYDNDRCCKTQMDLAGKPWNSGGNVDQCQGDEFVPCPHGKNCYDDTSKTFSNICPNGYTIESREGVEHLGDICRKVEGSEFAGSLDYMCPHGCVATNDRAEPECVMAQTGSTKDVCRIESSRTTMKHASPADQRIAFIINHKYEHTKLTTGGHDGIIQYSADYNLKANMLWEFEKGEIEDTWVLKGFFDDGTGKRERLRCQADGYFHTIYGGELDARDQWYIRPAKEPGMAGYYKLENAGLPGYYASLYSPTAGGCQPPNKNCIQYADSAHNQKCDGALPDNGFGEWSGDCDGAADCWGPLICKGECKHEYPWWSKYAECCIYGSKKNPIDLSTITSNMFRFNDLFEVEGAWATVSIIQNNTPDPVKHEYTLQYGVTNSYTRSMAFTLDLERSMSVGISVEADGIGASASQSATIGMEFNFAAESTTETTTIQKWTDSFEVKGNQCKKLQTIVMTANDACSTAPFTFYSKIVKVEMCGPYDTPDCSISATETCAGSEAHYPDNVKWGLNAKEPERWEVPLIGEGKGVCYRAEDCEAGLECSVDFCVEVYGYKDKCCGKKQQGTAGFSAQSESAAARKPKLHSLDQEYHLKESNTDTVMDKQESWVKNERIEKNAQAMAVTPQGPGLLVEALAALGLCATLYGAYRHYTQK